MNSIAQTLEKWFSCRVRRAESGCHEWTAGKNSKGYGLLVYCRRKFSAHRFAYQLYVGEIPAGMFVLHRCDNPSCCNPEHLFLGTNADNMRDMHAKGRANPASLGIIVRKLSDQQVSHLVSRARGGESSRELGAEFGVGARYVNKLLKGERRSGVTERPSVPGKSARDATGCLGGMAEGTRQGSQSVC